MSNLEARIVAFVDIIGFSDLIEQMVKERRRGKATTFTIVRDALKVLRAQQAAITEARRNMRAKKASEKRRGGRTHLVLDSRTEMTAFSDCVVISDRLGNGWRVLALAQALASWLLYNGIACRGAIARGLAYHKDGILFGPGIVRAYLMEREVAKWPRVLVEDQLAAEEEWWWARRSALKRDSDGSWYVNPFLPAVSRWSLLIPGLRPKAATEERFLDTIRSAIVEHLLTEHVSHQPRWDRITKWRWLALRFNEMAVPSGGVKIEIDKPRL